MTGWDDLLRLDHVLDLTDDTGIIQHANGVVPARDTGYCVDDVARLVVVGAGFHARRPDPVARRLVVQGVAFLDEALGESTWGMRNFMAFDRRWLDEPHLGDMVGRTVWALGDVLLRMADQPSLVQPAHRLLHRLHPLVERFDSLHEWVYAVLGLASAADCPECRRVLGICAERISQEWAANATDDWPWPEPVLTYDNARTPQALLVAGAALGDDELVEHGRRSLEWFLRLSDGEQGEISSVGNHWLRRGEGRRDYSGDEQPIDVGSLCEALVDAARILDRTDLLDQAQRALDWFLGANRLGLSLFDDRTAGCHDGLGESALNDNMGAESTLAFLQAALALERTDRGAPNPSAVRWTPDLLGSAGWTKTT